jgi:lipopolysaccharide/colanic/teichoic acid biosynthesis glycosyltransferase
MSENPSIYTIDTDYWLRCASPTHRTWRRFQITFKRWLWNSAGSIGMANRRFIDIAGALFALVAGAPFLLLIAILIRLEGGGPVLFSQTRIGKNGQPFKLLKFRSMIADAEKLAHELRKHNKHGESGILFKMENDPRVTPIGRFLRRHSLDEIPQFINVLRGEMSLVGPRPPVPSEVKNYSARHLRRLTVKPGLTGLWQVSGRSDIDFEHMVDLDLQYIRTRNLFGDIALMIRTIPVVTHAEGAY